MTAVPSALSNVAPTAFVLLILGEVLIFILIALDLRLLSPRKFSVATWISPLFALYVMASILLGLAVAISAISTEALASDAGFILAAIVGALFGTLLGRRIPVTITPEGKPMFTGGKALVGLLILLLLPRALNELVIIILPYASNAYDVQQLLGSLPPFDVLNILTGVLFVIGAFVGIGWRIQVRAKVNAMVAGKSA